MFIKSEQMQEPSDVKTISGSSGIKTGSSALKSSPTHQAQRPPLKRMEVGYGFRSSLKDLIKDVGSHLFISHNHNLSNYRFNILMSEATNSRPQEVLGAFGHYWPRRGLVESGSKKVNKATLDPRATPNVPQNNACGPQDESYMIRWDLLKEQIQKKCNEIFSKLDKVQGNKSQDLEQENETQHRQKPSSDLKVDSEYRKDPLESLEMAKADTAYSKRLLKEMQEMSEEEKYPYTEIIEKNLATYIGNDNTCYLVKYLLKTNEELKTKVVNNCKHRFEEMLKSTHLCRVVYTLCNHSIEFREHLLSCYKSRLERLLSSLPGAILLSLLIVNTENLKKCDFILQELKRNNDLLKLKFFGRAFATYMSKCPMEILEQISELLSKHFLYLLHDNYGNYLLQIFFERNCETGIKACEISLKRNFRKVFTRKYSRYVLYRAVLNDVDGKFSQELLELVFQDREVVESVIQKKMSWLVLLLALVKVKDRTLLSVFVSNLANICSAVSHSPNAPSAEFFEDLEQIAQCLQITLGTLPSFASQGKRLKNPK